MGFVVSIAINSIDCALFCFERGYLALRTIANNLQPGIDLFLGSAIVDSIVSLVLFAQNKLLPLFLGLTHDD
jgi:hypothetical protein